MKNLFYLPLILLLTFFISCEDEPIARADPSKIIPVNSELYNLVLKAAGNDFDNEITCIDFNYPFTLVIYNEQMDIINYQLINSDIAFSEFLASLAEGKSISLSYPITSVLENGQSYVINNNDELKEAIDKCIYADTIITCNNLLTETNCIWKVTHLDGPNSEYDDSYFQISPFGNAGFHFLGNAFGGTWITYFIENELHLNIFLTGDENIIDTWNYDWKVISFNDNEMEIANGTNRFLLTKECVELCRKILFEECETESNSGIGLFNLESYFECFFPFSGISDPSIVTWNYYNNYEDMISGTNPIIDLMHVNTENPQIIYVRFDDINTGIQISAVPIVLKAINC
ncbi:hypothetical protein QRD02_09000 [Aequorivita sp. SDUM287046]|uniref:DUF4249 family protein n=1 Tax=Aequorivita aurantiaca TaxID=3053356 RepID=A0ABT8DKJ5_9FLAO|nr:hypothetical protein [Aequorivita aurantiaca]MDN3724519.1 hypothetical protein [Aequorivita aurantiaca]